MPTYFRTYFSKYTEAAPLAVFRILFGTLMLISIIRFWGYGWIEKLYITPQFHFSYYGFQWIKPLGAYTYLLFLWCGLSAFFVAIGYKYRIAMLSFFLSFTYIELLDKTTYLNHYYFISVLSFLLLFLPANATFSVDAYRDSARNKKSHAYGAYIPNWTIDAIKVLLSIVYLYAGLAKLNSDWLLKAMPLKIWLPSKFDIPLIGDLLTQEWVHYAFSWFGAGYDLCIPILLFWKRTRWVAFIFVVIFHVLTRVLFPIGMFPYIMIASTLIFFDASFHNKIIRRLTAILKLPSFQFLAGVRVGENRLKKQRVSLYIVIGMLVIQLLLPWRYLLYPGELFWTEEGYRFSWRVMLMEKTGYAQFKIVNGETGQRFYVDNSDFLTPFQEKQMSFQPDFILEYAHYLYDHFKKQGHENVEVYAEVFVSLNGRLSTPYIDPTVNLATEKESFKHKYWILPFHDTIKGL